MLTLSGNTYKYSEQIKKRGGKYDSITKTWSLEEDDYGRFLEYFEQFEKNGLRISRIAKEVSKEMEFDAMYNESAEGYNPYRN